MKYIISAIGVLVIENDSGQLMYRCHPGSWTAWEYYPETGEYLRWGSDGNHSFYQYKTVNKYYYELNLSKGKGYVEI